MSIYYDEARSFVQASRCSCPAVLLFTHIFLSEIDEVLQIDVVSVGPDVVVDEQVELVFDPVLKDERQHSRGQLQEEDDS